MKKTNKSYFHTMVRDFSMFVIFVLISILIIMFMKGYIVDRSMRTYLKASIEDVPEELNEGRYSQFDIEKILGNDSKLVVLDKMNNLIYSTEGIDKELLTSYELSLIPNEWNRPIITREEYEEFKGKKYIELTFEYYENLTKTYQDVIVVNDKYELNFTTLSNAKDEFSEREFNLLSGRYETYDITKIEFVNNEGSELTALLFREYNPMNRITNSHEGLLGYSIFTFIVFFIVASLLYLISLNKKVKMPLQLLEEAIEQVGKGDRESVINYSGPYEFQNVCHKFNEMSLKLQDAEMQQKMIEDEKAEIVANISHDLKTPITVIQGFAKVLIDKKVSINEQDKYLKRIYSKSESMAELINTFSEYSKLERSDMKLSFEKTEVNNYIREYLIDMYQELELLKYEMDITIDDMKVYSLIDRMQLKRVFDNIISNTIKYTPKGTIIYFYEEIQDDYIKLYLGDNGPGIDIEIRNNLFKPFVVGNEARTSTNSSRLGMSIARKIIELHGGTIELVSNSNENITTVYEIILPKLK